MSIPELPGFFSASHAARITHHTSASTSDEQRRDEFYRNWQQLLFLQRGEVVESPTSPVSSRQQESHDHNDSIPSFPTTMSTNGHTNHTTTAPPAPKHINHTLTTLWFTLTLPIILWDATYCFLRPRSMFGGDLHYIWKPYSIYQNVDLIYGVKTYEEGGGFTNAQSLMNLLETGGNLIYLLGVHGFLGSEELRMRWVLVGFLSAGLTLAKTVLYWAQEYYCNYCAIGHNDLRTLILFWIIPNGLWIVFPSIIVYTLGKDLIRWLDWAERKAMVEKAE